MFQFARRSFWHVWSLVSAKEQKSARSARHRSFALQPAFHWSARRLHAPPRLASPSRRERGECSAAEGHRRRRLRVRRRPAPPEPTGPRHRGRLAGDRPKKRNCAFTRSNSSRNLDFLNAFASPLQVAKRSNCAFSTVRGQRLSPAVDNDSLEVTTSTRSRTRSSRRDGRCACHMRARRLEDAVDGPRAPQSGAAQQEQPPWLHDVHTYHRTHLLLSAALHDLTPHLLSMASSGSLECRMRCAIAHFEHFCC